MFRDHSSRWGFLLLLFSLCLIQGCGNRYPAEVQKQIAEVSQRLTGLKKQLDSGRLTNANIAKQYANQLESLNPDLSNVAQSLKNDVTSRGILFENLSSRLADVNSEPQTETEYAVALDELNKFAVATDPIVFNESLIDIVNTLADLSAGTLPRINIPKSNPDQNTPGSSQRVAGSYLVGNPNYGSWQTDRSGNQFWGWYGKYAFFSSLFMPGYGYGSRIGFNSWYGQPRYSYYNDYGRDTYGTSRDKKSWSRKANDLKSRGIKTPKPKKDYRSVNAKRRSSTYAYQRQAKSNQYGAKKANSSSARQSTSSGSPTKRSSSYSRYGSSFRGSSSGSRSSWGGK